MTDASTGRSARRAIIPSLQSAATRSASRVLASLLADQIERQRLEDENHRLQAELTGVSALLAALDARDHYTSEHSHAVVFLGRQVAERLALQPEDVAAVEQVALLHDLGKVGVPDAVLQKPGKLTEAEWELMREHPAIGARIVASISSLAHLAPSVRAEHERWDGHGYPDQLKGQAIPIAARITLACDAYHAMTAIGPTAVRSVIPQRVKSSAKEPGASSTRPSSGNSSKSCPCA